MERSIPMKRRWIALAMAGCLAAAACGPDAVSTAPRTSAETPPPTTDAAISVPTTPTPLEQAAPSPTIPTTATDATAPSMPPTPSAATPAGGAREPGASEDEPTPRPESTPAGDDIAGSRADTGDPDSPLAIPAARLRALDIEHSAGDDLDADDAELVEREDGRLLFSNEWLRGNTDAPELAVFEQRIAFRSPEGAAALLRNDVETIRTSDEATYRPVRNAPQLGDESAAYVATVRRDGTAFPVYGIVFRSGNVSGRLIVAGAEATRELAVELARLAAERTERGAAQGIPDPTATPAPTPTPAAPEAEHVASGDGPARILRMRVGERLLVDLSPVAEARIHVDERILRGVWDVGAREIFEAVAPGRASVSYSSLCDADGLCTHMEAPQVIAEVIVSR
jgi:hypothetical protein